MNRMTIEFKHEPLSFGDDRHIYNTWVIHRPVGSDVYNVLHDGTHVAYMPDFIAAKRYCENSIAHSMAAPPLTGE